MNKQEIIENLSLFPYSRDDYWIITGAAMVLYGIREQTSDIDIGCTTSMANQLEQAGYSYKITESGNRWSSPILCVKSFRYNQALIKLSIKHLVHEQPDAVYLLC